MEIDGVILLIDILGSLGMGTAFAKKAKKDLTQLSQIASIVPLLLFILSTFPNIGNENFIDIFVIQFSTMIIGILLSHISVLFGQLLRNIINNIIK